MRVEKWRAELEAGLRVIRTPKNLFLWQIEIGQILRVIYPAFGFDEAWVRVVVGWRQSLTAPRVEFSL